MKTTTEAAAKWEADGICEWIIQGEGEAPARCENFAEQAVLDERDQVHGCYCRTHAARKHKSEQALGNGPITVWIPGCAE